MKRKIKIRSILLWAIVIIFFLAVCILLVYKITEIKKELAASKEDLYKQLQENQQLREDLAQNKAQLQQLKEDLEKTKKELDMVNEKLSGAERNNKVLLEEKQALESKLHSLIELRKAIRQVKIEARDQRVQLYLEKKKRQQEIDSLRLENGNRGYLMKNGALIAQPKIKIEVRPAE